MSDPKDTQNIEDLDKQYTDDGPSTEFATLLSESEKEETHREVSTGEKVTGIIQDIRDSVVFVNYGGRSEAALDIQDVKDESGALRYKVGDQIEAYVTSTDGEVQLALSLKNSGREMLQQAYESGIPIEGKVTGFNPGGLVVSVGGVRAFCPMSQIDIQFSEDPAQYAGQTLTFKILELRGRNNVVLSRRACLEEEARKQAEQVRQTLVEGAEMNGKITRLERFGAFVDLGGIEGLIHVSEISHTRVESPGDVLQKGQDVLVKILELKNLGEKNERISLSLKALLEDPWDTVTAQLREGEVVAGKVVSLQNFGAFVELVPGVEGLVHISQISAGKRISKPGEVLSVGQEVKVLVREINRKQRRISLSMRAVEESAQQSAEAEDMAAFKTSQKTQTADAGNAMAEALRKAGLA